MADGINLLLKSARVCSVHTKIVSCGESHLLLGDKIVKSPRNQNLYGGANTICDHELVKIYLLQRVNRR